MKFNYHICDRELDTKSKEVSVLFEKLQEVYKKIPPTRCHACPGKDGVEADCCNVFSPPILLIEFMAILNELENQTEEEVKELIYKCYESFLEPSIVKRCVLLDGKKCTVYDVRPFSCRMFGVTSPVEWKKRLAKMSESVGIPEKSIPFAEQCRGIKVKPKGKPRIISTEMSNFVFRVIHDLDIKLFKDADLGRYFVMDSLTYVPFDAHYLLLFIGPDNLDTLASIKIDLRKSKVSGNEEEYKKKLDNVEEFLRKIMKGIFSEDREDSENKKG